jgi:hypothetical protein
MIYLQIGQVVKTLNHYLMQSTWKWCLSKNKNNRNILLLVAGQYFNRFFLFKIHPTNQAEIIFVILVFIEQFFFY